MTVDPNHSLRASGEAVHLLHDDSAFADAKGRKERLDALRNAVAKIEQKPCGDEQKVLPLGLPKLQTHLPGAGLPVGVLHEVLARAYGDRPSAFGFVFALLATALSSRSGPAIVVLTRKAVLDFGRPYSQGLRQHGIEPERLVIVETRSDRDAHWALEEAVRSDACPAMVVAAVTGDLNLTASRRLNLAAAAQGTPLAVIRLAGATGTSAAATRWNVSSAPAEADRFGSFGRDRWRARLERCRNGRPGEWLIEWTHGSHCFRLAEGMANRTPAASAAVCAAG